MNEIFEKLKIEIINYIRPYYTGEKKSHTNLKDDGSEVTCIDLGLSDLIENFFSKIPKFAHYNYYSEEKHQSLLFPAIIVDPIDGTKGLTKGLDECSVSIAIMNSAEIADRENHAFLYNPFSGLCLNTADEFIQPPNIIDGFYCGLISRSEFSKGMFPILKFPDFILTPKGSIALKLALLAAGGCNFVVTKRKKMIWDIAAGTILCHRRNIILRNDTKEIKYLNQKLMKGPLFWGNQKILDIVSNVNF